MKVTMINTSDAGGGAPAACLRLLKALEGQKEIDAKLLVQYKKTNEVGVTGIVTNAWRRFKAKFDFLYERLPFIFFHERDKSVRFAFSTANAGFSMKNNPLVKDADILHLHWTNSGFLSINDLKELVDLGKPIVWTLHDMWTFTGGCHYVGACNHFINQCGDCYFLKDENPNDISHSGWLKKVTMYSGNKNITFVACSSWLAGVARKSSLLEKFNITSIPNPIDTDLYSPQDKLDMRENWGINPFAKVILFGAANINDRRKGITYLVEALNHLVVSCPDKGLVEVVIFGKNKHFDVSQLPFKVVQLSLITSQTELAEIYSLADVFVTPSIEDNLPNTVMEALSCGTPVVAFNVGGIPEMVDHLQNGYLAEFESADDMAKGIFTMLYANNKAELSTNARNKVLDTFNNEKIAGQYLKIYNSVLNNG
jgi:glycosyltransferase involved in cell wall biosynthesis